MMLAFRIRSDYAHFSHPATIYSSLSYPVPPKPTVMGILAAIGGLGKLDEPRESYEFLNAIRYSVVIERLEGKKSFVFNGVKDALKELNIERAGEGFRKGRKQFYRELLVNPQYLIYVDVSPLADDERIKQIAQNLHEGISCYQPYLGVNFCLSTIEPIKIEACHLMGAEGKAEIDSFVPLESSFEIEAGKSYTDIRIPTTVDRRRVFGGFTDLLVETSGQRILADVKEFVRVGDRQVVLI